MKVNMFFLNTLLIVSIYILNIGNAVSIEDKVKSDAGQVLTHNLGVSQFVQMFVGLLVIVILIFLIAWFVKKMNCFQVGVNNVFKIISTLSVGQRERVLLIQVGEVQLLIGVAAGSVNKLLVLQDKIIVENSSLMGSRIPEKFSAVIKAVIKKS